MSRCNSSILIQMIIMLISISQAQQIGGMGNAGGWTDWPQGHHVGILGQSTPAAASTGAMFATDSQYQLMPGLIAAYVTTTAQLDRIPPLISHTPVQTALINSDIQISASAEDAQSGVDRFVVLYRRTGDISQLDSVSFSGDQATIPGTSNTQRGVEYGLKAVDGAGNESFLPETGFYQILAQLSDNQGVQRDDSGNPVARHGGGQVNDYRIFSVPIELTNKTPAHVFEDDLEAPNPERWRLWDVDNGNLRDYSTIRNNPVVRPGKGFLLIIRDANKIIDTGAGLTPKISQYSRIPLQAGWNLIGNPFDFDIPLNKLSINGVQAEEVWEFGSSGWQNSPTHLRRWSGLAVYAQTGDTLEINASEGSQAKIEFTDNFNDENWGMQLLLNGPGSSDIDNYIGVYGEVKPKFKTEWHEPPKLSGAAGLKIIVEDGRDSFTNLSTQVQKAGETGNYWDFEVTGEGGSINELTFDLYGEIPEGYLQYVIDRDLKMAYDITKLDKGLNIKINKQNIERRLRLLVGDRSFIKNNSAGVDVFPDAFILRQNFPNPFNPATNIVFILPHAAEVELDIFNILGQRVRRLLKNELRDEGYHLTEWDGRNDYGAQAASGLYFIRFRAAGKQIVKKAIFAK